MTTKDESRFEADVVPLSGNPEPYPKQVLIYDHKTGRTKASFITNDVEKLVKIWAPIISVLLGMDIIINIVLLIWLSKLLGS